MSNPVAKQGDHVIGIDTHVVMVPSPAGPVPTPMSMPFSGPLSEKLSSTVFVDQAAAAVKGSVAKNYPPHIPTGGPFQRPPQDRATIDTGSATVFIDGSEAARADDTALTCNDPADAPNGFVRAAGTVFAG